MNRCWFGLAVLVVQSLSVRAQTADAAATNAPVAATNAVVAESAADAPPEAAVAPTEWTGFVRAMGDGKGGIRAVRLVAGDKLYAVEMNEKALALAQSPRTRRVLVKGELAVRDNRPWLIVSQFEDAPDRPVAPAAPPASAAPPADTNAPAVASGTNAPVPAAGANAPPADPAQP